MQKGELHILLETYTHPIMMNCSRSRELRVLMKFSLQDRASEREWTWVRSSHHEHGEDSLQRGETSVCHHNHHHVLKIYILKVISINKFNTIFEIIMAIFQEADAYECRTGIEEGGVKKTIVVSLQKN